MFTNIPPEILGIIINYMENPMKMTHGTVSTGPDDLNPSLMDSCHS